MGMYILGSIRRGLEYSIEMYIQYSGTSAEAKSISLASVTASGMVTAILQMLSALAVQAPTPWHTVVGMTDLIIITVAVLKILLTDVARALTVLRHVVPDVSLLVATDMVCITTEVQVAAVVVMIHMRMVAVVAIEVHTVVAIYVHAIMVAGFEIEQVAFAIDTVAVVPVCHILVAPHAITIIATIPAGAIMVGATILVCTTAMVAILACTTAVGFTILSQMTAGVVILLGVVIFRSILGQAIGAVTIFLILKSPATTGICSILGE